MKRDRSRRSESRPIFRLAALVAATCLLLNACVMGYRRYPRAQLSRPDPEKKMSRLYYDVTGTSLFGGASALKDYFTRHSPARSVEFREQVPSKGTYVKANVELLSPSIAAAVFGYVSYATLTLLPVWSTKDGARIVFEIYKDGAIVKSFDYEVRRTTVGWFFLLPFVWANLLTANEEQVFTAVAKQFFADAQAYLTD